MMKKLFIAILFLYGCSGDSTKIIYSQNVSLTCEEILERSDGLHFVVNLKIENSSSQDVLMKTKGERTETSPFFVITKNGDSIPLEIYNRSSIITIKTKKTYIAQGNFSRALFWKSNQSTESVNALKQARIVYVPDSNTIKSFRKNSKKQEVYALGYKEISLINVNVQNVEEPEYIPEIVLYK